MLPSLSALRAFDAAARLGSFRAAADHLSITPTAIGHHIQGLEDTLEVTLFLRAGREVRLTEDGKRLAETTGQAFGMLDDTVRALRRPSRKCGSACRRPNFHCPLADASDQRPLGATSRNRIGGRTVLSASHGRSRPRRYHHQLGAPGRYAR